MKQANFCKDAKSLMYAHSRAIAHMRSSYRRKKIGLILGAGVSKGIRDQSSGAALPDWPTLIQRIASDPKIEAQHLMINLGAEKRIDGTFDFDRLQKTLSSLAQMIFQHFKSVRLKEKNSNSSITLIEERKTNTEWMRVVHRALYKEFGSDEQSYEKAIQSHPYLSPLVDLAKEIPLTVNFNFDDAIERFLFAKRDEGKLDSRGFTVVLEPSSQISRERAVIYHPNGALPFVFEDGASPDLVFSDDAFHDQISSIASGRNLLLTNYLFSNTCILLGLSLDDISLQQTLRRNAVSNPGNPHYIVHYMKDEESSTRDVRESIFKSNFDTFGVYTIFLNDNGIAALLELLSMNSDKFLRDFSDFAEDGIKFVYYLIGAVGVGKSTAVKHFQSLQTYDEWVNRRLPAMSRPRQ